MSGGRVELGLGAGWYEAEHEAYAIPFPSLGERFERLEEQLAIVSGLWANPLGERFSFTGRHYAGQGLPGPARSPCSSPPRRSSSAATARPARPASPPATRPSSTWPSRRSRSSTSSAPRVRAACEAIGRDPSSTRVLRRARPVLRRGRGRVPHARGPPSAASPTSCASTAPPVWCRRWRPPSTAGGRRARSGSTCRCSTCPTSSTSSWSPRRWRASCRDPAATHPGLDLARFRGHGRRRVLLRSHLPLGLDHQPLHGRGRPSAGPPGRLEVHLPAHGQRDQGLRPGVPGRLRQRPWRRPAHAPHRRGGPGPRRQRGRRPRSTPRSARSSTRPVARPRSARPTTV